MFLPNQSWKRWKQTKCQKRQTKETAQSNLFLQRDLKKGDRHKDHKRKGEIKKWNFSLSLSFSLMMLFFTTRQCRKTPFFLHKKENTVVKLLPSSHARQ